MNMFAPVFGRGTLSFTVGAWTYVLWRRGVKPQNLPSDFHEHSPSLAVWLMGTWLADGRLDRFRQCDVYREFNPSAFNLSGIGHGHMESWLNDQLASGHLRVGCFRGPYESFNLAKFQESRTKLLGGDVPNHADPVPQPNQTTPYTVYEGSGGAAVLDQNDAASANPTCPNAYHRSETLASASPEVRTWLDTFETRENGKFQSWLLGGDPAGGGGFLKSTTEVISVPAGITLWRYIDDPEMPWGSWWFFHPYEGDPRVFGALPEKSSGNVLVQGKTKEEFKALCGPGAPRCTNKPGGPPQLCIPYTATINDRENSLIRLV